MFEIVLTRGRLKPVYYCTENASDLEDWFYKQTMSNITPEVITTEHKHNKKIKNKKPKVEKKTKKK